MRLTVTTRSSFRLGNEDAVEQAQDGGLHLKKKFLEDADVAALR